MLRKLPAPDKRCLATALDALAHIYIDQRQFSKAETCAKQALAIREDISEPNHSHVAATLQDLAVVYVRCQRYGEAIPLLRRKLAIDETRLGKSHPELEHVLTDLESLYRLLGRDVESSAMRTRIQTLPGKFRRKVDHKNAASFPEDAAHNEAEALGIRQGFETFVAAPVRAQVNTRTNHPSSAMPKRITDKVGMNLVLIPAGSFLMGSSSEQVEDDLQQFHGTWKEYFDDEQPQHRVQLTQPFYLGVTEVTIGQFRKVVELSGFETEAERDGQGGGGVNEATKTIDWPEPRYTWRSTGFKQTDESPVVNVSWNDAIAFCNELSNIEGLEPYYRFGAGEKSGGDGYRLPTEAEWEYACRAGTTTRYVNGTDPESLATLANVTDAALRAKGIVGTAKWDFINGSDGYAFTASVRRFQANAFGLYDMHGNVWEWCWDGYDEGYYKDSPTDDPNGPVSASFRVLRGGSWSSFPRHARSSHRHSNRAVFRDRSVGFRVARGTGFAKNSG